MNIPNIYTALTTCQMRPDLRSDIHIACIQMGWPEPIPGIFVPRGPTAQAFQLASALCISTAPREKLLTPESLKNFDVIIAEAQANWVAINKGNKVSRILTDYLKL